MSEHYKKDINKQHAKNYEDSRFSKPRMKKLDRMEKKFAHELFLLVGKDASILDIPCGSGRFFDIFAPARELYMLDYAPNMVEELLKKHPEAASKTVRQGDIMNIDLPDNSVDLAFCMRLFHHFPDEDTHRKALRELARVSRKYVAFSFYCKESFYYWRSHARGKPLKRHYISMKDLIADGKEFGLKLVKRKPSWGWIDHQRCVLFEKITNK